jgi:hypothetical protein
MTPLPPDAISLHIATGNHPFYGNQVPCSIGQTEHLVSKCICEHTWLVEDDAICNTLEALLIYAYSSLYNSSHSGSSPALLTRLRTSNRGRFWHLLLDVASGYDRNQPC